MFNTTALGSLKRWIFLGLILMLLNPFSLKPTFAETNIEFIAPYGSTATTLFDVDNNYLYYLVASGEFCSPMGEIFRIPKNGGSKETLYANCEFDPWYAAVDGKHIFVMDWGPSGNNGFDGKVLKLPTNGGQPTELAYAPNAVLSRGFATDTNFVYWIDSEGLKKAYKTGIGTQILVSPPSGNAQITKLVVDETHIYFNQITASRDFVIVKRVSKSGGIPSSLYSFGGASCLSGGVVGVDDDALYLSEAVCDGPNVIKRMPKDGRTGPTTLLSASASRRIVCCWTAGNLIFFIDEALSTSVARVGNIRYINQFDGTVTNFVVGHTLIRGIQIDASHLYWNDNNQVNNGTTGTKREELPPFDLDRDGFDQTVDCDDNNSAVTEGNTCVSDSPVTIESDSGDVTVTFQEITGGGSTSVAVEMCTPPDVKGITIVPTAPLCADINTSATFEGEAEVCISYDDTGLTRTQEANLQMVHCEDGTHCELLACNPPEPVDTVNNIVCGCTAGFSTFAVGTPLDSDIDFVPDLLDNCPNTFNPFQEDTNHDGIGDACSNKSHSIQIFLPLVQQ